jgi:hypothetical protein
MLSELHGNSNLEICSNQSCGHQYLRDFHTRSAAAVHAHETGRNCSLCGSMLHDSIINFGESLPQKALQLGFHHSYKADLCIALGSSLRVTPAADMPLEVAKRRQKLVIINLQATPLDNVAALRINARIDDAMMMLMQKLAIDIPPFKLRRYANISVKKVNVDKNTMTASGKPEIVIKVEGVDADNTPFSLFKAVTAEYNNAKQRRIDEPFTIRLPIDLAAEAKESDNTTVNLKFVFQGHYYEPDLTLTLRLNELAKGVNRFQLTYDPLQRSWDYNNENAIKYAKTADPSFDKTEAAVERLEQEYAKSSLEG